MSALVWTESLRVNQSQMDRTHEEFVGLLEDVRQVLQMGDADAGLASHMAEVGFEPATGTVSGTLPQTALTHCGSTGCR
jgi:hypothetical protein